MPTKRLFSLRRYRSFLWQAYSEAVCVCSEKTLADQWLQVRVTPFSLTTSMFSEGRETGSRMACISKKEDLYHQQRNMEVRSVLWIGEGKLRNVPLEVTK